MKVNFELVGRTPLLMHADNIEEADKLTAWRKAPENKNLSKPGDDRSPAWTWQTYCYSDGAHLAMPAENIMVCLRQAGAQMILKKQKTYKEVTQSGLYIETEYCSLLANGKRIAVSDLSAVREKSFDTQIETAKRLGFRLFTKRAKVGQSKHIRVRPRFETWKIQGEMIVTASEITFEILEQLFDLAGYVGLGDWRPGCRTPGPFGMFRAKIAEVE